MLELEKWQQLLTSDDQEKLHAEMESLSGALKEIKSEVGNNFNFLRILVLKPMMMSHNKAAHKMKIILMPVETIKLILAFSALILRS